jgi:hypothetical protein
MLSKNEGIGSTGQDAFGIICEPVSHKINFSGISVTQSFGSITVQDVIVIANQSSLIVFCCSTRIDSKSLSLFW